MIVPVVNGIFALAEPYYLANVSREQLERDLVEEVRLFGVFSEGEMGAVERYVHRLVASWKISTLSRFLSVSAI